MKYAVITCSNGNFAVQSEWTNDIKGARIDFRTKCNTLDNEASVKTGAVILVNENFDQVGDYKEIINHEETPEA